MTPPTNSAPSPSKALAPPAPSKRPPASISTPCPNSVFAECTSAACPVKLSVAPISAGVGREVVAPQKGLTQISRNLRNSVHQHGGLPIGTKALNPSASKRASRGSRRLQRHRDSARSRWSKTLTSVSPKAATPARKLSSACVTRPSQPSTRKPKILRRATHPIRHPTQRRRQRIRPHHQLRLFAQRKDSHRNGLFPPRTQRPRNHRRIRRRHTAEDASPETTDSTNNSWLSKKSVKGSGRFDSELTPQ